MRKFINDIRPLSENIDQWADDADPQYEADSALEKQVRLFCEKEIGWEFDVSYAISVSDGEITIKPAGEEVTLEQVSKLSQLGTQITISAAQGYQIMVTMRVHDGLSIAAA